MRATIIVWVAVLPGLAVLRAQCPLPVPDTLAWETFEAGLPPGWETPTSSDGGLWQVGTGSIGVFGNPGKGSWLYIDDVADNSAGTAQLLSPVYDIAGYAEPLRLSFDLLFQEYAGTGSLHLELLADGKAWTLMEEQSDFDGTIDLDLAGLGTGAIRFRITYDDEGLQGWGAGIDHWCLQGLPDRCGDGICEPGEQDCADCPPLAAPAPMWIAPGQDFAGQQVTYHDFKDGLPCDDCSEAIDLGFDFAFFGNIYRRVYLNANGNLSVEAPYSEYTPNPFCLDGPGLVAPFFSDVDLLHGGAVSYYHDPAGHYFIATWAGVAYFGCEADCALRNTFQLILTDGSIRSIRGQVLPATTNVVFVYGDMQWTTGSSSSGVGGFGGYAATVGLNLGDGIVCHDYGTFDRAGYAYYGNTHDLGCPPNAVSHLDHRTLFFDGSTGQPALPQGLILFEGMAGEDGVLLWWEVDVPDDLAGFELARGADTLAMTTIGEIDTADYQPGQPGSFQFADPAPPGGEMYYRLTSRFGTDKREVSRTIVLRTQPGDVANGDSLFRLLQVGPVPLGDVLHVRFEAREAMTIDYLLVSQTGQVLRREQQYIGPGPHERVLPVADLPPGIYVLSFFYPGGKAYRRLVKDQ